MKHAHTKIWLHLIWTPKNREHIFTKEMGKIIYQLLLDKSKEINVQIENLNIQPDHIHTLIDLPTDICLSDYMQKIKGASSRYINKNGIFRTHFSWQRGYGGYSVSSSQLEIVKNYIKNQTEHHRKITFEEEYNQWKKEYGIIID